MVEELKQMAGAAPILAEWFGEGGEPVSRELAGKRANVCRNIHDFAPCEKNVSPNWWQKNLTNPIAQTIIALLEFKQRTELHLPVDVEEDLNMCLSCGCALRLKIWTPIKHIAAHTTPEQLEEYPAFCWILREIKGEK